MEYGIKVKEVEWFTSYLSGRSQFCTVNGHNSRIEVVICGIPQGSCLGPLFFIIYLNSFESCLEISNGNINVDDAHTTISSGDIAELIRMTNMELLNISDWLS